jgi:hypothetical protein
MLFPRAAVASLAEFPAGGFDVAAVAEEGDAAAGGVAAEAAFGGAVFGGFDVAAVAEEGDAAAGGVAAEAADVPPRPST